MKTSQAIVGLALVAGSNAFVAPGSGLARASTRSAIAPVRMQANNPSDNVRRAADNVKNAGKDALHKAENAADRAAGKVDAKASQASSNTQARTTVGGTEIRAADIKGKEVVREAPLTAVHIHENTEVVDKTKVEEERIKTEVIQKVQPIHEEERRATDVKRVDHGTEVRHHGKSGLDQETKAELEKRRQQLAETTDTTREATKTHVTQRPDVVRNQQTQVIEQVVPVLDKDIYVQNREEHEKKVVEVYHEAPELVATQVEQTISKEEFEKKYGTKLDTPAMPSPTGQAATASTSTTNITGRTASSSNPVSNAATANMSSSATARSTPPATGATSGTTNYGKTAQSAYISEHQKQQQHDAATNQRAAAGPSAHQGSTPEDEPTPYSMSSSNMARDAEEAGEEGEGIGSKIKNAIKSIVE